MKQILLIMIGLSVSIWADFSRDNSTGIVTDNSTGLQWQDDVNGTKTFSLHQSSGVTHMKFTEQ